MSSLINNYKSLLHKYESELKLSLKPNLSDLVFFNKCIFDIYNKKQITKTQFEIVIARYNESITSWKPYYDNITVYNKGKDDLTINSILLDNVGRESHTYLYHIINKWDNLADITLFTQCNFSSDHKPFPVPLYYLSQLGMTTHLWNNQIDFVKNIKWGNIQHGGKWLKEYNRGLIKKSKYSFGEWWDKYILLDRPDLSKYKWSHGGIFSVHKSIIHKKPKKFYENLLSTINNHINPEEGHYIERSWLYIFS